MTLKRLPDAELEVMKALWELGSDTPRSALEQALAPFSWAGNTINTYLSRLTEKGFLSVHKDGKSNLYTRGVYRLLLPSLWTEKGFLSVHKDWPGCMAAPPPPFWPLWPGTVWTAGM